MYAIDTPTGSVQPKDYEPARVITARTFEVVRVIDGDTIVVTYDSEPASVRLVAINTPERGEPGYDRATDAMRQLAQGEVVRLTFTNPTDKRDDFGRPLATVEANGQDVGKAMLRQGLAEPYHER